MQSIFRLPWCSDPIAPKMDQKAPLEDARQSPVVDIPMLNKALKRKHSLEPVSPLRAQPNKKQRPEDTVASPLLPSANTRIPAKNESKTPAPAIEDESQASCGAASANTTTEFAEQPCHPQPTDLRLDSVTSAQGELPAILSTTKDVQMDEVPIQSTSESTDMSSLQEVIENEFNMQILMKHNELRLIEQELAKCQVALEQLRRCELRPYPGDDQPSELVSAGTGAAITPAAGYTRPSHAAPYGVTDGPYSRHYSSWLLRDPSFDSTPLQSPIHTEGFTPVPARSTRTTASSRKSVSKPFSFPGRPGESLPSIPNYPAPAPKEKGAPQVLKRSTDGQLVKLICNNCHRGNFSSIQGFLNHCRIAHKVDYKSHDAAAIDCGQLLDENEAANLPPETQSAPAPKPSAPKPTVSRSSTSTAQSTPARNFSHFVHPLNTTSGAPVSAPHSRQNSTASRKPIPKIDSAAPSLNNSPLTPSPHIPHLSAYFAKHHLGGYLAKAAASAKQKVDLCTADEDAISPSTEQNSPLDVATGARTVAGNAARPSSRKGYRAPAPAQTATGAGTGMQQRPRPSPLAPMLKDESMDFLSSPAEHASVSMNLSPHTADSNPGLVSDHEDEDDEHSDSGEEPPAPVVSREEMALPVADATRTCGSAGDVSMGMEIDVAVEDDVGRDGVVIRRNSLLVDEERGLRTQGEARKLGGGRRV